MTTPAGAVAADAKATQQQAGSKTKGGGDFFSRKYGPLPGWGWALLAAGGALAFFWWRSRESKASTSSTTSTALTGSGWAGAANALQQEIDQLQGQGATSTATTTAKTTSKTTTTTTPTATLVTVPNVVGMRTDKAAVPTIKAAGLKPHIGGGFSSTEVNYVNSQTPGAGTKVAKGSTVDLGSTHTKPK
jgi:hypothetical protein